MLRTQNQSFPEPSSQPSADSYDRASTLHDWGNLVQIVSSSLDILAREITFGNAPMLNSVIVTARSSLEHANSLVRQSLGAACDEASAPELVDLGQFLVDLLPSIQSICGNDIVTGLVLGSEPLLLSCRRHELESTMLNLSLNARNAMPRGGDLAISGGMIGKEIFLRVSDTGTGMSQEICSRALDPFFTTRRDQGGSGIGLALVARFVDRLDGRIELGSTPGVGTVISLLFKQMEKQPTLA